MKRRLNGYENAVITGMSAPGTTGDPQFSIEIGEVYLYEDGNDLHADDHERGIIDHVCCIPDGQNKGWVGIRASPIGDAHVEIVASTSDVLIELHDRMSIHSVPTKSSRVPRSEFTSRGFDLLNVSDNHGKVLTKNLSAYIWQQI